MAYVRIKLICGIAAFRRKGHLSVEQEVEIRVVACYPAVESFRRQHSLTAYAAVVISVQMQPADAERINRGPGRLSFRAK